MNETLVAADLLSPRGHPVKVVVRPDTTDMPTLCSTLHPAGGQSNDEYGLAQFTLSGWAADIGAHIGSVTLALLADNPDLRVIAVEPLADNVRVLREALAQNGWTERCVVVEGGIGADATIDVAWGAPADGDSFVWAHRFIGNQSGGHDHPSIVTVPGLSFRSVVDMAGGALDLVKWDCEGCEWVGLTEAQEACRIVLGEWHDGKAETVRALLEPTHDLTVSDAGGIGAFTAVRR